MLFIIIGFSLYEILFAKIYYLTKGIPYFYEAISNEDSFFMMNAIPNYNFLSGNVKFNYLPENEYPYNSFCCYETYDHQPGVFLTKFYHNLRFNLTEREYLFNFTFIPFNTKTEQVFFEYNFKEIKVINMVITVDVTGTIFELINDVPKNFSNLIAGHSYYFYIKSNDEKHWKNANLSLTTNYNSENPFKLVYIYELNSLDSLFQYKEKASKETSFKNDDENTILIPYIISLEKTQYIFFQIIPQYNIDNIYAKINFGGGFYFINDSNYLVSNLTSRNNYDFVIKAFSKQIARINLTMNYMENIPFESINIIEFTESNIINKKYVDNVISKYQKINDEYTISLEYCLSYGSSYINLGIFPEYDIQKITINKVVEGGVSYFPFGRAYRQRLVEGFPYYLYVKVKEKQKVYVNLELKMSRKIHEFIKNITIYEYIDLNSTFFNNKQLEYITDDTNITSFSYEMKNQSTNYIVFYFVPIDTTASQFYGEFNVAGGAFDCTNNKEAVYSNLISENDYYFYISANVKKNVSIEIIMNNQYKESLDYIQIYEYSKRYDTDFLEETTQKITINESNDKASSLNYYQVISNYTNYICVKIRPKIDVNYYYIQINVTDFSDDDTEEEETKDTEEEEEEETETKDTEKEDTKEEETETKENEKEEDKSGSEHKSDESSIGKGVFTVIILGSIIFIIIVIVIAIIILRKSNKVKSSDINNMEYSPIQPNQQNELK